MKNIFIICALILFSGAIIAQTKITGVITDQADGESLPGATVYIPELKTGTVADKNGVYHNRIIFPK